MSVLYITYDGILEPLGQSQVLRYQVRLANDHKIVLVSFEKAHDWQQVERREALRGHIRAAGITWLPLRYHKRPSALATAYDIAQGVVVGAWAVMRHRIRIVHARSYVPSVIALVLKKLFRLRFIFDMRGFWADERVDGGLWPAGGRLYRVAKWFERRFLLNADCVVSLTQAAVDEMRTFPYLQGRMPRFEVITTCADLGLFKPVESALTPALSRGERGEEALSPTLSQASPPSPQPSPRGRGSERDAQTNSTERERFVLGYVGSVGVWYLFDETLRCFQLLRERVPDARLHILNRGGHDYIHERMAALNVDPKAVQIEAADHAGVAHAMQQMDAGIFFIKPVYSKTASAPTKLGEFLGCGVPCLGNAGVGDMASILERERVGVALRQFDETTMREAVDRLLQLTQAPGIRGRCREVALRYFSLEDGVASYRAIYDDLAG
jgi:glycosyltransferase involved in cell wall biosynthesis